MTAYRQTLLAFLLTMFSGVMLAQNNTNSPYTRYGYGQLAEPGSGNSKAMGGVAYGLRDKYQVNFANPASYTAIDSLTFIFDGGVTLQNTNFSNGTLKTNAKNTSFDYITMQFRLKRWAAMSIGLIPFSSVGYSMSEYRENTESPTSSTNVTYAGDGGLHQLYVGAGIKILKNLSAGVNISYLWGDISHSLSSEYPQASTTILPYYRTTSLSVKSYKLDFGAQYTQQFNKKHAMTLGVAFSPKHDLANDATVATQLGNTYTGATSTSRDTVVTCGIPMSVGAGLAYVYDDRLTVGLDFLYQKWSGVSYMNNADAFCDRARIALGAEYMPNPMGRSYFAHVRYRVGAYYSKPYYKIDGERAANEYGVTAGFGLPVPRTRSVVTFSAQYAKTKGTRTAFLDENTFRICVGITFNDRWFFKRKVD